MTQPDPSASGGDRDSADTNDFTRLSISALGRRLLPYAAVIILVSSGVGVVTYLTRAVAPATYEAVARFSITPNDKLLNGTPADLVDSVAALDRPIVNATVSELLQSGAVAEDAAAAIALDDDVLNDYDFSATEVAGAAIVRLSITGPDDGIVSSLTRAVRDSELDIASEFGGVFDVQSIDRSAVGVSKVAPNPGRDALAAALATAIGMCVLAVLFDARMRRTSADASRPPSDDVSDDGSVSRKSGLHHSMK